MKIVEHLNEKKEAPKVLALPEAIEVPKEVEEVQEKYFDKYGINNTTAQYIKERKNALKETETQNKREFAENELVKNITNAFGVYPIVSYKTMDEIAKKYNLYMTSLGRYLKPIPEENLAELDSFTEYLGEMDSEFLHKLNFWNNRHFIFAEKDTKKITKLGFDEMFYIMAPASHLNVSKENDIKVGREISESKKLKPRFTYKFEFHKIEPKDPIIFLPFSVLDKIYCVVITAWDKVADDIRIRKMI